MANLKHDASGFLTGDKIDLVATMRVWGDIRRDVSAIKSAIIGSSNRAGSNASKRNAEISRAEAAMPRGNSSASTVTAKAIQQAMSATGSKSNRASIAVSPTGRDNKGRFVKSGADSSSSDSGSANTSTLRGIADRIASSINGASGSLDEVDPAAKAFSEVAQPMARGYSMLMGDSAENKKERWYKRIYSTLTGFRKEESLFHKVANKSLKNIENKEDGGGDGSSGGGLLSMLSGGGILAGIGAKISSVFTKIPFFKGAAAKGVAGGVGKGLLKKIPFLGALLGGIGAASDVYGSETDEKATRGEKDKRTGKAVGGFGGTLAGGYAGGAAGAAIGTLIFPGIGTAIGAFVGGAVGMFLGDQAGQIIGDKVGEFTTYLRDADIPGKIMGAWNSTTDAIKTGWSDFVKNSKEWMNEKKEQVEKKVDETKKEIKKKKDEVIDKTGKQLEKVNEAIKKETGVDLKKEGTKAIVATEKKVEEVKTVAKDKGTKAIKATGEAVEWAGNNTTVGKGVKWAGKKVVDIGSRVSEMYKAVSGYTKDPKEQAMLMANLDHETGGFKNYEEGLNYRSVDSIKKTFKGNKNIAGMSDADLQALVKNPEKLANTVYANKNGNTEEGDGYKFRGRGGLQITGRANYAELSKRMGLGTSLVDNPDQLANDPEMAAKASIEWLKMNKGRVNTALKNGDDTALRKVINGGKNGLDDVVAKTAAWNEKIAGGGIAVASAPASKVPAIAQPPVIADAAPVVTPMAYNDRQTNAVAQNKTPDVSQDISDRRIAHVVTGGLSA